MTLTIQVHRGATVVIGDDVAIGECYSASLGAHADSSMALIRAFSALCELAAPSSRR